MVRAHAGSGSTRLIELRRARERAAMPAAGLYWAAQRVVWVDRNVRRPRRCCGPPVQQGRVRPHGRHGPASGCVLCTACGRHPRHDNVHIHSSALPPCAALGATQRNGSRQRKAHHGKAAKGLLPCPPRSVVRARTPAFLAPPQRGRSLAGCHAEDPGLSRQSGVRTEPRLLPPTWLWFGEGKA